jgi:hypothetical protein
MQKKFKENMQIMKFRQKLLREVILPKYLFKISVALMMDKFNPKNKGASFGISKLTDTQKNFICECCINLAKFDFRAEFLNFYLKNKVNLATEEGRIRYRELEESIE